MSGCKFMCVVIVASGLAMPAAFADEAGLDRYAGSFSASEEQFITVSVADDALQIEGNATWGMGDPDRVARGGVNVGEFSALVPADWIDDGAVSFAMGDDGAMPAGEAEEYDCVVSMQFSPDGSSIAVEDNMMCGGMNVTFSGTYTRTE